MDVKLECEDIWAPKNWCFWTVVLEKTLESPLDCKEIQPVHSKGDQSWVLCGRPDAKAETPVLWPPDAKSWLIGKEPDAGRDWGQEEKGTTEDEMAGWHHRLDRREFDWTPGAGDEHGGLACCISWGLKESDMTEQLNWTEPISHVWKKLQFRPKDLDTSLSVTLQVFNFLGVRNCDLQSGCFPQHLVRTKTYRRPTCVWAQSLSPVWLFVTPWTVVQ